MAGAFQVGPFQPAFQQEGFAPFYPIGGYPGKKKRKLIEVEHEGQIYEFETEEAARELVESIAQEYTATPEEVKQGKPVSPPVSLRVDDVKILAANLRGYSPASAILADRFDLIYAAARQAQDDDDEEALLLLM